MGNNQCRSTGYVQESGSSDGEKSRRRHISGLYRRLKNRLGRHGHGDEEAPPSSQHAKLTVDDLFGIACIEIREADMGFEDKWFACLSVGEQTFRTVNSEQTARPVWNSVKKIALEKHGAHIARVSVFETNRLSRNNLIGYCEFDLLDVFNRNSYHEFEVVDLVDPSCPTKVVGTVSLSYDIENPSVTEKSFVKRLLAVGDVNEDGQLSFDEFSDLVKAFGNEVANKKIKELFSKVDRNGDGVVSIDELTDLLASEQEMDSLINCCPVCGESLGARDRLSDIVHLTLCFNEGTGDEVMTGGFLTDKQASYGWMFKLSEWAHFSSYDVGLKSGSSASHILVFDRRTKRLVEELIDGKIILSMRAIYQSKVGLTLVNLGVKDLLQNMSEKQGRKMDSPESAKDIPKFVEFFKDQINLDEIKYSIDHFKTFNEFFIRELKPGARQIAEKDNDRIAVCAADSRLMAFKSIDDSLRLWIKGRKFSIKGLLGTDVCYDIFDKGSLVIFRLAPQDYHHFHMPVSGNVEQFVEIPGYLYTVNPIAVNSKYCNVFTENKRVVSIISTLCFGKVAFVAIGATMVGSIHFSKKKGEYVRKGEEFGYFSFGGSTVICVFEKGKIDIEEDLLANSARSLETLVSMGTILGKASKNSCTTF
ncbi:phosphatidylserine decarboxylase proenzyme 2-like [Nymphaea colorata]|nr:phosphatidylserine decarboxylase proenzyme 2-like [Nymphaea colorata]